MCNRIKTSVIAVIAVIIVPAVVVRAIMIPAVTVFLKESLGMDSATAISAIMDYLSLSYAVLLGMVVYRQTERINQLEATQYDMYVGVESIDYSCNLAGTFATNIKAGGNRFTQVLGKAEPIVLFNVEGITAGDAGAFLIPLSFVVKSQPLVTSVCFERMCLNILDKSEQQIWQGEYNVNETINAIFADGSHLIFCLGLILPKQRSIGEIDFNLTMVLENQIGQKQKVKCSAIMVWAESKFNILSSYSKRLP